MKLKKEILQFVLALVIVSCTNPFAPKEVDYKGEIPFLSDQKTVEGVFKNFSYAYKLKDTLVYGQLLAEDFTFVFRNYYEEPVVDKAWGRDVDLIRTYKLFQWADRLDLTWNEDSVSYISSLGEDTLILGISRSFSLDVTAPNDNFVIQGKANFKMIKTKTNEKWRIFFWSDESNF